MVPQTGQKAYRLTEAMTRWRAPLVTENPVITRPSGRDRRVSACILAAYHTIAKRPLFTRKGEEPDIRVHYTSHTHLLNLMRSKSDGQHVRNDTKLCLGILTFLHSRAHTLAITTITLLYSELESGQQTKERYLDTNRRAKASAFSCLSIWHSDKGRCDRPHRPQAPTFPFLP